MCTLLQSMMLLDSRHEGYEFSSISADEIMRYAAHIKNNYSEKQKERLYDIIDYLEKVFPEKDKMLKKINIPIVMLTAVTAMGSNYDSTKGIYRVGPMYFRQWFSYFFDECYENYKQYCSSGSIKKEKTLKRIDIMENSLRRYFELEDDAGLDIPSLGETLSPNGTAQPDGVTPFMGTGGTDDDPLNEKEPREAVCDSDAGETASHPASRQEESGWPDGEEKPPEEASHDTE